MSQKDKKDKDKKKTLDAIKEELKHIFHKADVYEEKIVPGHILYGYHLEHMTDEEIQALYDTLEDEIDDEDDIDILSEDEKKAYIA